MSQYVYFTDEEVAGLDKELCAMLDMARGKAKIPFVITSGLRTAEQNATLPNAVCDSAHLTGHAVDLRCEDDMERYAMVNALLSCGFNRMGIYFSDGHLHVDNDTTKPAGVIWLVK